MTDRDEFLRDLNDAQRQAVLATSGPVLISAGAGTGKTRVVSHRAAHAVASGVVEARRILLVTFTEKAGREMAERVAGLGLPSIAARTFHSAALAQLRYFWPGWRGGEQMPEVLGDKWRIVSPLARRLPGGYRFTPTRDLIDEIEWARSRRLDPSSYEHRSGRTPPIPMNLFVRLFGDYERAKRRQGVLDFDDILSFTVDLLEQDANAAAQVRERYSWFTVDEFQDTTPLQFRLLELWLGDRRDICVVGDEDQTIYSFAGATPAHLVGFTDWFADARVIPLLENYRSTPQVLSMANDLLAATGRTKRLQATRDPGPSPSITQAPDDQAEVDRIVGRIRGLIADGVIGREIAILFRLNAQIAPFEAALTRAGIPYQVRGQHFFARRDVKNAIDEVRRVPDDAFGDELVEAALERWEARLGYEPDAAVEGREARERQAAFATLLSIVREAATDADRDEVLAALAARAEQEQAGSADGVELLTLHRAKGLEWDAVFLPSLEEGLLPVAQAADDEDAIAEERRLLYVGITRARIHLVLSWAQQRASTSGKLGRRTMSRFLTDLGATPPPRPVGERRTSGSSGGRAAVVVAPEDEGLFAALKAWRLETAKEEQVPAYVVANDSTLAQVAVERPRSSSDLLEVNGIGPAKLERYGDALIALVDEAD